MNIHQKGATWLAGWKKGVGGAVARYCLNEQALKDANWYNFLLTKKGFGVTFSGSSAYADNPGFIALNVSEPSLGAAATRGEEQFQHPWLNVGITGCNCQLKKSIQLVKWLWACLTTEQVIDCFIGGEKNKQTGLAAKTTSNMSAIRCSESGVSPFRYLERPLCVKHDTFTTSQPLTTATL